MKGYFSQIAKQSGLLFSGRKAEPRQFPVGKSTAENLSPLEKEETLMIPPSVPDNSRAGRRETQRSEMPAEPQKRAAAPVKRDDPTRLPVVEKPVSEERQSVAAPTDKVEYPLPAKKEKAAPGEKSPGEFSVIERTVFKEINSLNEPPPQLSAVGPGESKKSSELNVPSVPETKHYFLKTAEIIEKAGTDTEETGTEEMHRVLFQEIQEWAAVSPQTAKPPDAVTEEGVETIVSREVLQPQSRRLETIQEKAATENVKTAGLTEQNFDLSIGTISIVIEDAEKPLRREPPLPNTTNQNSGRETKREYSRLSRNYL